METWGREGTDDVIDQIEREGADPKEQVHRAGMLPFSDDRLLPVDLAIRGWARRDTAVAERLRRVDNRRMELLREEIGTFCADPDEVEARSLLAFCAAIGEHFLAADHPGRSRAEVLTRAADFLLDRPPGRAAAPQAPEQRA
ncbi:hypothetical protein [Nocardiopsis metallicus]|uniref:TetR family transcriptional regulator n=1 Tax=Nocardiopsis metallicus TaxID=179819 RepID=A0A840VZQ3_9ACTN|nr:hypothetical protein [Nocardiopsis metallicus]MBB5489949.1 hypothetical protein [Nocardiopsis metallicus]